MRTTGGLGETTGKYLGTKEDYGELLGTGGTTCPKFIFRSKAA